MLCIICSSFLIADHVYVASVPAKIPEGSQAAQYIFSSSADDSTFEVYPDPRGNTLQRGTEITLVLKDDASEFLERHKLQEIM